MRIEQREEQQEPQLQRPLHIASDDKEVILGEYTPADVVDAYALIDQNRDHLSQFDDRTATKYPTLASFQESVEDPKNPDRLRFGIHDKEGHIVGSINLTPNPENPQEGEIGYYLGAAYQGKGYTTRAVTSLSEFAFNRLGYQTLHGVVHQGNLASRKVLERAGYTVTGLNKDDKLVLTRQKPIS